MRYNEEVLKIAKQMGYTTVGWNVGAKDFLGKADAEMIEDRVLEHVKNGSIILLHDCPDTAAALPGLLAKLRSEGYTFRTVTEMLARLPKPVSVPTNAYAVAARPAAHSK
jgi:peptidoglycan/xylan/chitin deacetylase (PgdA/CDA1 family)